MFLGSKCPRRTLFDFGFTFTAVPGSRPVSSAYQPSASSSAVETSRQTTTSNLAASAAEFNRRLAKLDPEYTSNRPRLLNGNPPPPASVASDERLYGSQFPELPQPASTLPSPAGRPGRPEDLGDDRITQCSISLVGSAAQPSTSGKSTHVTDSSNPFAGGSVKPARSSMQARSYASVATEGPARNSWISQPRRPINSVPPSLPRIATPTPVSIAPVVQVLLKSYIP